MLSHFACRETRTMVNGYEYIHHVKNEGNKPKAGDKVQYHVDLLFGNTVLNSTSQAPAQMELRDLKQSAKPSPIEASLRLMSEGDSLTVFTRIDTIGQAPSLLNQSEYLTYHIVLLDIEDQELEKNLN